MPAYGKLSVEIQEIADGKDWKLVARRKKRIERTRKPLKAVLSKAEATLLANELLELFNGVEKAKLPKHGFMIFLYQHYPEHMLRDAISRAKADCYGNV